jgi:hypothetical protein
MKFVKIKLLDQDDLVIISGHSFYLIGGLGFLLAGISSYFKINLLPFANPTELVFIPQGLVMMFYGTLSLGLSIYINYYNFFRYWKWL